MTKKIGFLGGTFNPIHTGHLMIAESAREYLGLEKVIFIPSGCSYMKAGMDIPDAAIRLEMTELAVADNPFFAVSDMEIKRAGNTYTYETIHHLHTENPDTEIVFIVGADTLFTIELWKAPERIFAGASIAAAVRDDKNPLEMQKQMAYLSDKYQAKIHLLPVKNIEISSTDIREQAKNGKSLRYMIPDAVREYILKHEIYGRDNLVR